MANILSIPRGLSMFAIAAFVCLGFPEPSFGQQPGVQLAPAGQTDPTSGPEMFKAYCSACHGPAGKGNGPAASALKVAPADLTQLTVKNKGKFPEARFMEVLERGPAAHGNAEMPVWGPVFNALDNQSVARLRMANLSRYVQTLQTK